MIIIIIMIIFQRDKWRTTVRVLINAAQKQNSEDGETRIGRTGLVVPTERRVVARAKAAAVVHHNS